MTGSFVIWLLLTAYAFLLLWLATGYLRTPFFKVRHLPQTPVTIIICARNEGATIARCLRSIAEQVYDQTKIQLIVVNDASNDNTLEQATNVLENAGFEYLLLSNAEKKGKKRSITLAMTQARYQLVVVRDADTYTLSNQWLQALSDHHAQTGSGFIIAPVAMAHGGLLGAFQVIENNVLTVLGCGGVYRQQPFVCSAANLAFTRQTFDKVGGYASHLDIASGDDVLFMQDVKNAGGMITYLKSNEALVYTYACESVNDLLAQKLRWTSKFRHHHNFVNRFLAVITLLTNGVMLLSLLLVMWGMQVADIRLFIVLKVLIDLLLLFLAQGLMRSRGIWWYALPAAVLYPLYGCFIGVASVFFKPKWK